VNSWALPEGDYVKLLRPRGLLRLLLGWLHRREDVALAKVRGQTVIAVTERLANAGQAGRILSREESGAEVSVIVTVALPNPLALRPPQ
jgi:hypothetical protein